MFEILNPFRNKQGGPRRLSILHNIGTKYKIVEDDGHKLVLETKNGERYERYRGESPAFDQSILKILEQRKLKTTVGLNVVLKENPHDICFRRFEIY